MPNRFEIPGRIPHFRCLAPDDEGAIDKLQNDRDTKLLHFIRHGQAVHQLKAEEAKAKGIKCQCHIDDKYEKQCPYNDPELIDSSLTELGKEQVAGKAIGCSAQVILSSPTRRALETAIWAFNPDSEMAPEEALTLIPPIVAVEELRARIGIHMHSQRSSVTELKHSFPQVDFSHLMADDDALWSKDTESRTSLDFRAARFLQILFERPEKSIAIITHFTLLITLFNPPKKTLLLGESLLRRDQKRAWMDCRYSVHGYLTDMLAPGEVRSLVVTLE